MVLEFVQSDLRLCWWKEVRRSFAEVRSGEWVGNCISWMHHACTVELGLDAFILECWEEEDTYV